MNKIALIAVAATTAVVVTGSVVLVGWGGLRALTRKTTAPITAQSLPTDDHLAQGGAGRQGQADRDESQPGRADQAVSERQYPNAGEAVTARETLRGTVEVGTDMSNDIVVRTEAGEQVTVGSGPEWLQKQGFALTQGETVTIVGYWEDGEFKAAEITRQSDGATIVLRDADGRPAWSGAGQRAQARDAASGNASGEQLQGQGGGQGRNRR